MIHTFSSHKIVSPLELPFDAIEYSKFKFGDKDIARKFGERLAQDFIKSNLFAFSAHKPTVVCSSPYCFIPTATFAMKDYFVKDLNACLTDNNFDPVEETKVHRTITYKEDYGGLSAEERMNLIGKDSFHIDKEFVKGKHIIFLDDVRITGSHEKVVIRMAEQYGLDNNMTFLYFAELANPFVSPSIENFLNYAYVKSLLHLDRVIKNGNFLLNTRVVKYILNADFDEFTNFILYQSDTFVQTVYHQAIGNSYHKIDDYRKNLTFIKNLLKTPL